MVDIFLYEPANGSGKARIGDHGLTLMRLSYTYGLDTENKQRIFNRILAENRIQEQDGRLQSAPNASPFHRRVRNPMQNTLSAQLTQFTHILQQELFPRLEPVLGPISHRGALFIAFIASKLPNYSCCSASSSPSSSGKISKSFFA